MNSEDQVIAIHEKYIVDLQTFRQTNAIFEEQWCKRIAQRLCGTHLSGAAVILATPCGTNFAAVAFDAERMHARLRKPDLFLPAALLVERQIALTGHPVVDVHPLAKRLGEDFPRHEPQELCAAIITAIALRGGIVRWQPHARSRTAR